LADLLKNKSQPEAAANGVEEWVEKERQMRERLKKEKDAREQREKAVVRLSPLLFFPLFTAYPYLFFFFYFPPL
jgi:hypothetical protein